LSLGGGSFAGWQDIEVEGILKLLLLYIPETKVTSNKSYIYLQVDDTTNATTSL